MHIRKHEGKDTYNGYRSVPTRNVTRIVSFELTYHDFRAAFDFQLQGADCLYRIHLQNERELSRK